MLVASFMQPGSDGITVFQKWGSVTGRGEIIEKRSMRDSAELLPLLEIIRLYLPSIWISENNLLNLAVVDMLSQLSYSSSLFT